jgi:hypothetical protein
LRRQKLYIGLPEPIQAGTEIATEEQYAPIYLEVIVRTLSLISSTSYIEPATRIRWRYSELLDAYGGWGLFAPAENSGHSVNDDILASRSVFYREMSVGFPGLMVGGVNGASINGLWFDTFDRLAKALRLPIREFFEVAKSSRRVGIAEAAPTVDLGIVRICDVRQSKNRPLSRRAALTLTLVQIAGQSRPTPPNIHWFTLAIYTKKRRIKCFSIRF